MKVKTTDAYLTNFEVLQKINAAKLTSRGENLQTIVVELQAYLKERPAGNPLGPQNKANIVKFVEEIRKFDVQDIEIFQLVNAAANSLPVLFCLLEEADNRFSEEQLEHMIELSEKYLGAEPVPGEE